MPLNNDLLTFDGPAGPTSNSPIIRDDEEVLIVGNRSCNASSEWQIRGYKIYGYHTRISADSVEQADLAAVIVEEFDGDALTRNGNSRFPLRKGVPVTVATDGKPAIAAWLRVRGHTRDEIAELLSVGGRTVTEYLSRFRSRGTGIPAGVDAPAVGSLMPELPSSMDYSGGEEE